MVDRFASGDVKEETLQLALKKHVEHTDTEQAMEYVEAMGLQAAAAKEEFWIAPLSRAQFACDMQFTAPCGTFRLQS